jgi:hypothetical protein
MKKSTLMLAVVMASMAAFAQSQMPAPLTAATVKKQPVVQPTAEKKAKVSTPLNYNIFKPRPETGSGKTIRVDGESSQPWFRMAGPRPGWTVFPGPGQNDLGFNLFWIGADPLR